ncbi:MAG: histidine kinase [Desulfobulbaceae bacterium]|uniref:Histidine kinase n=1 Tax=Candidatus Desulfobia pelagia TaxID=2841692 RepID=A0A8J6NC42_9BACT|nr:histidine kinase [Candidatus Desulfobia pelagia]
MAKKNADMERLETILRELKEAVIVCDQNAQILLYNSATKRLFHSNEALGLGQSLYGICTRAPIEHTLRMLKRRETDKDRFDPEHTDVRFVCAAVDDTRLFHCRISQITSKTPRESVFVLIFEDITRQITETGRQGHLLETMIKNLRAPITNLNAAAETLKNNPEMAPEIRDEFEDVIFRESAELTQRFEAVTQESRRITQTQWPLSDVYSEDLVGCVSQRCKEEYEVAVTMTGVPLWLHADSHSLMRVLECLVRFVQKTRNVSEVDMEALLGDRRVYLDIVWKGEPIPQAAVDSMLKKSLSDTLAGMTVAEVLERHDSEMWCQKHRREGYSLLRIPVPDAPRQWEVPPEPVAERPVFYDFSLLDRKKDLGKMAEHHLASLNYVVFDTEITGLCPSDGDEILALAAVKIVNGRILSGERFERFIKPTRPIPVSSLPFLGITEDMLLEESPVQLVLPQFKSFVDDAVLVAHNGAFDMNFFQLMEEKSGVKFENPLLDTLLLAIIAEKNRTDHTLESIGRWLGVEVMGSRTLMDDCFVTAQIFLRLLELLEGRGITTLGKVISASERVLEEKRQQFS